MKTLRSYQSDIWRKNSIFRSDKHILTCRMVPVWKETYFWSEWNCWQFYFSLPTLVWRNSTPIHFWLLVRKVTLPSSWPPASSSPLRTRSSTLDRESSSWSPASSPARMTPLVSRSITRQDFAFSSLQVQNLNPVIFFFPFFLFFLNFAFVFKVLIIIALQWNPLYVYISQSLN